MRVDDRTLSRWSQIGQALEPVGVFFSGVAFIGIAVTLFPPGTRTPEPTGGAGHHEARTAAKQRDRLATTPHRSHQDGNHRPRELREVWPPIAPGVAETKKDHYCNLILDLQKVAYEARTIELAELRGALKNLMTSPDMYAFWWKARAARGAVTGGDEAEAFFTAELD